MERRHSSRIPVEMWVEQSTSRELYFQRGANISEGGIYLQKTIPHSVGTKINMQFTLPGDSQAISVQGEIVNISTKAEELGMGVKFIDLNEGDRKKIERFIELSAPIV